jgi:hypothetical protein
MTCPDMSTWHAEWFGSSLRLVKESYDFCYDRLRLWVYDLVLSEPKIMGRKEVVNAGDMLEDTDRSYRQLSQTDYRKIKLDVN